MKLRPYRTFICWQYSRAHAKSTPILPAIRIKPHQAQSNPVKPRQAPPPLQTRFGTALGSAPTYTKKSLGISSKAFLRVGGRVRTDDIQNHNLTL